MTNYLPAADLARAFDAIPRSVLQSVDGALRRGAREMGLRFYHRRNRLADIPVALKPWVITPAQRRYLAQLYRAVEEATIALPGLWRACPALRPLLPFTPAEERWLEDLLTPQTLRRQTLFGRLDARIDLGSADWKDSLRLLETNMVGLGAVYYAEAASQLLLRHVAPLLAEHLPGVRLRADDSFVGLQIDACRRHARRIGRGSRPVICLLEADVRQGPAESERIRAQWSGAQQTVRIADPADLRVHRGEVCIGRTPIDILYRDPALSDLIAWEDEGFDLAALRHGFRRNQVVAGLAGDFDCKSVLEIFSDPALRRKLPARVRPWLARHTAWTRCVRETRTVGPDGAPVDLISYIRRRREQFLLKPNVDYGGHGIAFGDRLSAGAWDEWIDEALADPSSTVVQEIVEPVHDRYPVRHNGGLRRRGQCLVAGYTAGPHGVAFLARAADDRIVNLTANAALAGLLVAERTP